MTYKIRYDEDADVLTIVVKEKGKLSHAEEIGDIIVHFDMHRELFLEILKATNNKFSRSFTKNAPNGKSRLMNFDQDFFQEFSGF